MIGNRILLVDDEELELKAWRKTLEMAGYSVATRSNPLDALAECDEHAYDLVILDFLMPSMTGIELLARIRKKRPLIRSVIISGKIDKGADAEALTAEIKSGVEADRYIHKPVSNSELRQVVAEILSSEPPDEQTWTNIAKKTEKRNRLTIKSAKNTSKLLRQHVKKKK